MCSASEVQRLARRTRLHTFCLNHGVLHVRFARLGNLGGNQDADIPGSLRSYTVSGEFS